MTREKRDPKNQLIISVIPLVVAVVGFLYAYYAKNSRKTTVTTSTIPKPLPTPRPTPYIFAPGYEKALREASTSARSTIITGPDSFDKSEGIDEFIGALQREGRLVVRISFSTLLSDSNEEDVISLIKSSLKSALGMIDPKAIKSLLVANVEAICGYPHGHYKVPTKDDLIAPLFSVCSRDISYQMMFMILTEAIGAMDDMRPVLVIQKPEILFDIIPEMGSAIFNTLKKEVTPLPIITEISDHQVHLEEMQALDRSKVFRVTAPDSL